MLRKISISIIATGLIALGGAATASVSAADSVDFSKLVILKKVAPKYPRKAAMAGLSGWVDIEFVVSEQGTVDSPKVVKAKPKRVFDRAAVRALTQWKFEPIGTQRHSKIRIDFKI